jgi:hypothetical protein
MAAYERVQKELAEQRKRAQALRPLALNAAVFSCLPVKSTFLGSAPALTPSASASHSSTLNCVSLEVLASNMIGSIGAPLLSNDRKSVVQRKPQGSDGRLCAAEEVELCDAGDAAKPSVALRAMALGNPSKGSAQEVRFASTAQEAGHIQVCILTLECAHHLVVEVHWRDRGKDGFP